jgi:hypothetical protein
MKSQKEISRSQFLRKTQLFESLSVLIRVDPRSALKLTVRQHSLPDHHPDMAKC